jgi:hypothetical protein
MQKFDSDAYQLAKLCFNTSSHTMAVLIMIYNVIMVSIDADITDCITNSFMNIVTTSPIICITTCLGIFKLTCDSITLSIREYSRQVNKLMFILICNMTITSANAADLRVQIRSIAA